MEASSQIKSEEPEYSSGRHMFILLDFLNKCNLRCIMCGSSTPTNTPETVINHNIFEKIAEALFPVSKQVNLSCLYEPFTFKGILDYLEIAVKYHVPKLTLTTNAILLTRPKAERIVKASLPQINISIDGATKKTYESIRIGGSFDSLLKNLRNLAAVKLAMHREKPKIQFNFVLMGNNFDEVSSFIQVMSKFKPYKFVFIHRNNKLPPDDQRLKIKSTLKQALVECVAHKVLFEEVPNLCITFEEILQAYGCNLEVMPQIVHKCEDPWHFMRIAPNGDVFMCPNIGESAGNIFRTNVLDIWNGEIYNKLRKQLHTGILPANCKECPYSSMGLVQFRQLRDTIEHLISQQMFLIRENVGQEGKKN